MDVVTHGARTEEDKAQALESGSRLRSSARLGYINSSSLANSSSSSATITTAAAAAAAAGAGAGAGNTTNTATTTTTTTTASSTTTCRTSSKRKRKKRRRQQRSCNTNDNDNNENNNDTDEVDVLQTVPESSSSSASRTHTNSSILVEDNILSPAGGKSAGITGSGTGTNAVGSSSIGRRNEEGTSRHRHNHNNNNNNNNSSSSSGNHHRRQQRTTEDNDDNTATGGGGSGETRGEGEGEYNNNSHHHEEEEEDDEELVDEGRSYERNHRNTGNYSSPNATTNITTTTTTLRNGGNNSNTRAAASSIAAASAAAAAAAAASAAASSSSSVPSLGDITFLNRRTAKRSARRCNNASGRRNAMTMDLQRLINEVHGRPAIWDQKNVNYHNRDVILKMWREIARACDVSTDVAKSKWKHLRDNFRNELKKTYRGKCDGSSLGGGSEHDSKWVWFRSLFFLRDQMNSRVIGCALNQNCAALRSSPDGTQIEPQIDILEGHEETQFDDLDGDSCQSLLSNDDGLHHVMPPPKMNKIGRKRILMEAMDNDYPEMDRKRYDVLQKRLILNQEEEDDTYHFLMSVRNPLRSLPLDRQMFVRLKIQELVYNEINSQNHQIRGYDSSQDVKPLKGQNDNGNGTAGNNGNNGDVVSDMSNPASLLQNCATEGSSDDAFFG